MNASRNISSIATSAIYKAIFERSAAETTAPKRVRFLRRYLIIGFVLGAFLSMAIISPPTRSSDQPGKEKTSAFNIGYQPNRIDEVTQEACAHVVDREISCEPRGGYTYTFTVTNTSGQTAQQILLTPPAGSSFTISPQVINQPLQNGASTTLTISIGNAQPGQTCFFLTLMAADGPCCTIRVCPVLPNCCATARDVTLTCNADGSYTYVFSLVNTGQNNIQYVYLYPPAGVTMTPNYFALSPVLQPGGTFQTPPITITGAHPGGFDFDISVHSESMKDCCKGSQHITLPPCGAATACAEGMCCARPPIYSHTTFNGVKKVSAVTGWPQTSALPVVTVFDLSGANSFVLGASGSPNNAPTQYIGPSASKWNATNLGSVFGVTFDHLGNIYVTASSAFSGDSFPNGGGRVYRLDNNTGAITNFGPNLPNLPLTTGSTLFPGLGNISFDCHAKQFFVTNMDDGRIYRLAHSNGQVLSTYNHATNVITPNGSPDPNDVAGFAPLGHRLWAVKVHGNRVYYSVVNEDCGNHNSNPAIKNEIWSVGINSAGDFDISSKWLEVSIPDLAGTDFSNPVSDISFSWDGRMLLSERTMGCSNVGSCPASAAASNPNAHASRVLEYVCNTPPLAAGWTLAPPVGGLYKYNIGRAASAQCPVPGAQPANSAGGNDYDYDPAATFRTWATGDYLNNSPLIYGLQGISFAGGDYTTSALIGLYGIGGFKTEIGDVAVSCPPGEIHY